ncbi:hypothetical protein RJ640_004250 [Escallonia rubra]|uniref:SAC3/GANP/THP3 conserved domain-containing protein n=1 Tax=Escallonia rubra TaxID=112253 RepID=A0AA88RU03_9ASTE|nr:hypothetical protein RJ640_004250 [Escallonia rubra]
MIPIAITKVGEGKTEDEEEVEDNGFEYRQCVVDVVIVEDEEEQELSLSLKFTACVVNGSQGQHGRRGRRTHSSSSFNQSPHQFQSKNPTHTKKPSYLSSSNPMKDDQNASNSSSTIDHDEKGFPTVTGTCPFMCPEEERALRERLRDLAVFERLDSNPGKTSSALAVKKVNTAVLTRTAEMELSIDFGVFSQLGPSFCRTISSKQVQASDVRPLAVLEDTLKYLFNLLDSTEHPFEVVHEFIFDRTRSIRQDLSMQNIIGDKAVHLYERMGFLVVVTYLTDERQRIIIGTNISSLLTLQSTRPTILHAFMYFIAQVIFHVVSDHKLRICTGSPNISPMHQLNMEQLTKALTSLYFLYEANLNSHSFYKNEAEFRSFYVLLHLGSQSQPMGESLSLWLRDVPHSIVKSKEMCFARRVLRYFRVGNYKRFLCTIEAEASCLQYCILQPYISEVRAFAVSCVNYGGYKIHPYPLPDLSKLLLMKEVDVESFCSDCGLETTTDEVGKKFLPMKQTSFCHPKRVFQNYFLLDSRRLER